MQKGPIQMKIFSLQTQVSDSKIVLHTAFALLHQGIKFLLTCVTIIINNGMRGQFAEENFRYRSENITKAVKGEKNWSLVMFVCDYLEYKITHETSA